jgi:hypothetical protein
MSCSFQPPVSCCPLMRSGGGLPPVSMLGAWRLRKLPLARFVSTYCVRGPQARYRGRRGGITAASNLFAHAAFIQPRRCEGQVRGVSHHGQGIALHPQATYMYADCHCVSALCWGHYQCPCQHCHGDFRLQGDRTRDPIRQSVRPHRSSYDLLIEILPLAPSHPDEVAHARGQVPYLAVVRTDLECLDVSNGEPTDDFTAKFRRQMYADPSAPHLAPAISARYLRLIWSVGNTMLIKTFSMP